ncbi:amino acid adenylation domain-containing protein [Chromobacterium phragmitis]|uniref:amino acid adenylation domain-containing protein n=1 Tax=Chromobacterium phragmitis TaxID=2202141 RepID=UPI00143DF14A|nr:amino acid adenylation domain-containing protein [Chromobacterium phragmitis]
MSHDHVSAASNRTERAFDSRLGFHHLFESMARVRPDAPAVGDGERALSYAQLSDDSSRLAAYLAARGAGPGAKVSIFMDRSIDLVVAMLAIAKTGAAYIPLDPAYPERRLHDMVEDSGTTLILTHRALQPRADALAGARCESVALDANWPRIAASAPHPVASALEDGQLAYVIYTSGSTGQPKGVMVGHVALTNFLQSMAETPGMAAGEVMLAVTTHSFDISGLELLLPLIAGGLCWLCPADAAADAHRLLALMERVKPTIMQATPATWTMLSHAGWTNERRMKVLCGGEPLPDALKHFFDRTCADAWNMYGPTETTIWSTVERLEAGKPVSIGRPIANTRVYIAREDGRLCDVGEAGELCIAGLGLAQGYLNKPELTAGKFAANPYESSGRLYRTGDLAHWQPDGSIMHLGRIDNQVKIRGHRIEIGAIEAHLDSHPGMVQSVVVARQHPGGGQLAAYCVAEAGSKLSPDALRDYLAQRLPGYMVPAFIVEIDEIPLTPSGKTDRKALAERPVAAVRAAASAIEADAVLRFIIDDWQGLLGVADIGADTRFRDIGGNSVAANLFISNINKAFGLKLTLTALQDCQSPADIARVVAGMGGQAGVAEQADGQPEKARVGVRHDIAIVGMAGRFPGADTVDAFWANVAAGRNCVSEIGGSREELRGERQAAWAGLISGVYDFDPAFFRISPREAELMDPQQRLMLICAWRALEDAGIAPQVFRERRTGVFVAASQNDYALEAARQAGNAGYLVTGHAASMIPNRISHSLDLFGPSECVETTCSSSLVALHRAVRAIRQGECEQAIVGGVNLLTSPEYFDSYEAMGLLSADRATRTFQPDADGYVRSEGLGVAILKPLERALDDGDFIHAVVKGTSVNHGGNTASLTTPSAAGIAAAMRDAVADSGVAVGTIGYIEAHGTGSVAGDDVEVAALQSAFEQLAGEGAARGACALGGLKPCIGHTEIASGMAALFKVAKAMSHGVLPGVPGVRGEDARARWPDSMFRIEGSNRDWTLPESGGEPPPRRAGINSYGFGVNAHVIVEAHRLPPAKKPASAGQALAARRVAVLSARTPRQLATVAGELRAYLSAHPGSDLASVTHTLQVGRQALAVRLAIVAGDVAELANRLERAEAVLARGATVQGEDFAAIGGTFYSAARRDEPHSQAIDAMSPEMSDPAELASAWAAGVDVRWASLSDGPPRLPLPGYPFQLEEYRVGAGAGRVAEQAAPKAVSAGRTRAKRICVVGAGPGGLVMAKSLLEEGHAPVVYEAQGKLGGVWNLERDKTVGTYSTTRFQNSKDTSFFSDFYPRDMDDMFPNVRDVRAYLEAYTDRFDLKRHIHCGVSVTAVREDGGCWQVETVSEQGRKTETFDGVALCHGRYQIPRKMTVDGLDRFPGKVMHAGQYYDNAPFAGKRVLVIGNGVSGMDIATEASKVADAVYWSIRSRKFILPRMVGFLPNDFVSPVNLLLSDRMRAQRHLDRLALAVPEFNDAFERSGMRPSLDEFMSHPFIHINDEVVGLVASGRIRTVFGQVDRFEDGACYHQGSEEAIEDIDIVVECGGYRTDALWHYLDGIEPKRDFAMGLFHRRNPMLVNQYGLQEVGVIGTFPHLEMVSRWYAQIVSGKYALSEAELALDADTRQIVMGPLANVVIGMKLGFAPDPSVEFKAFWALLNRPCFPAQYRLRGAHAWADAAGVVEMCRQRAFVHGEEQDPEIRLLKFRLLAGLGADALRRLLETGEITEAEREGALAHLGDPLVVDWNSQFLTPADGGTGTRLDPLEDEYRTLIRRLKDRTLDGDGLLRELKKLSRVG